MKNKLLLILALLASRNLLFAAGPVLVKLDGGCKEVFQNRHLFYYFNLNQKKALPNKTKPILLLPKIFFIRKSSHEDLIAAAQKEEKVFIALYAEVNGKEYLVIGDEIGRHMVLAQKLAEHLNMKVPETFYNKDIPYRGYKKNLHEIPEDAFLYGGEIKIYGTELLDLNLTTSLLARSSDSTRLLSALKKSNKFKLSNKLSAPDHNGSYDSSRKHLSKTSSLYSSFRHDFPNAYSVLTNLFDIIIDKEISEKELYALSQVVEKKLSPIFEKFISDEKIINLQIFSHSDIEKTRKLFKEVLTLKRDLFDLPQEEQKIILKDVQKRAWDVYKKLRENMEMSSNFFPYQIIELSSRTMEQL